MSPDHPYKKKVNPNTPHKKIPKSESLKDTYARVVPYYEREIEPLILSGKNILIVFHGNTSG